MKIPQYTNKSDLYKFLRENKKFLVNAKKGQIHFSENCSFDVKSDVVKAFSALPTDTETELYRQLVINTSNFLDGHGDVHIGNIWTKSLQENTDRIIFFQEHNQSLDKIIADGSDLKIYVKQIPFIELGYNSNIITDALIFEAAIRKNRNEFMFNQYLNGYVKQHSVAMQYIKLAMCMDSPESDDMEEKIAWDKYYPMIANKDRADQLGYFFAVTEARLIEGSAVALGSNPITPTISNNNNKSYETLFEEVEMLKSQVALLQPITKEPLKDEEKNNFYTIY